MAEGANTDEIRESYNKGEEFLKKREYDCAIEKFTECIKERRWKFIPIPIHNLVLTKEYFLLTLVIILLFGGCASTVSSYIERQMPSLPDNQHITVFGLSDIPPVNSQNIAFISIGDSGFSVNCSYSEVVDTAVKECRRLGGNALKITSMTEPDFFSSSCYRISATVLYINN